MPDRLDHSALSSNHDGREDARLLAMLREDTGSDESARVLLSTVKRLRDLPAPETDPDAAARLVESLLPHMPVPELDRTGWHARLDGWWPWLLMVAQLRVVRREIWAASALVMALGLVVTMLNQGAYQSTDALPFVLVSPLVAALGVAFLYSPDIEHAQELENATPTSPRVLLLVRLALVFGFNLGIGLAASAVLALLRADVVLWPLIVTWLAPMAFLSALAFLMSVMFTDPLVGVLVAMTLWSLQSIRWFMHFDPSLAFPLVPNLLSAEARPWLLACAALFGAVALWLAGREDRYTREPH